MEMMDYPEWVLIKLAKSDKYLDEHFLKSARVIVKESRKMKDLPHEEERFNELNADYQKKVDLFEQALDSQDAGRIASGWKVLKASCKECHNIYD